MDKTLEKIIPIANMLAETLGKDCQIVIYDLTNKKGTVAHTVNDCMKNSELTRRLHPIVAQMMFAQGDEEQYCCNYMFVTAEKRLIRSSVASIRDDAGELAGAFCINIDTGKDMNFVNWLMKSLTCVPELGTIPVSPKADVVAMEPSASHISKMTDALIDRIIGDRAENEMSREDKVSAVSVMEQNGLFLVKGAVEKVADKLGIAKVTVYSYLDEIKDTGRKIKPSFSGDGERE